MTVVSGQQVECVRAFNRDYTRRIGVLSEGLLGSPYSLTEVRVLYEIAHRPGLLASELVAELGLDRGYLSRLLKRFESQGLLSRKVSARDARQWPMRLTASGKRTFAPLERRSQNQVREMLLGLDASARERVLEGMQAIQSAFAPSAPQISPPPPISLRGHRPGDMGWVIERHGRLYAQEYGWSDEFEALVAEIAAHFLRHFEPARERCWIAERNGERLGSIFLVAQDQSTAKLRLLLVEPQARGQGLGQALIAACIEFARAAGYQRVLLWTQQHLLAARHLYEQAGFVLIEERPHHSFGHDLIGETWQLDL